MINSSSNWRLAAFDDDLSTDNSQLSVEQESAKHNIFSVLERMQDAAAQPLDIPALAAIVQSITDKDDQEAVALAEEYMRNPIHNELETEPVEPEVENEVSQEQMMQPEMQTMDSTVPNMAPPPGQAFGKYPGHHGEGKPGDKKHLKGEGPVNEKANEIYHAIMREKGDGEPSKEDQSSAAAIAWSQAKKHKKKEKKTYFRGKEVDVLDSYRDMWGESVCRIRVEGRVIEVPQELIIRKSSDSEMNEIEQLIEFVEEMPKEAETIPQILARKENLKTAKDMARALMLKSELSFNEEKAIHSIHSRCASELEQLEEIQLVTQEDIDDIALLPTFEIGKDIYTSSFTQHSVDWDSAVSTIETVEDPDKFVREDPILLVSELPETLMSDAGAVRTHAKKRVASVAAYIEPDFQAAFVAKYLENAENARRSAYQAIKTQNRKTVQQKKASFDSVPDEGLFL